MDKGMQADVSVPHRAKQYVAEQIRGARKLYVGIDIGSTSSDVVVLDNTSRIIFSDYKYIEGAAVKTAGKQLEAVLRDFGGNNIAGAAVTGSAGRLFAELLGLAFVNEVPAQAAAICHLYKDLREGSIIEMGGQDSKLIFLSTQQGKTTMSDFALSWGCAAGTGSFLDQQAERLGIKIEGQFGELALQSKSVPRMAGRCAVFAKTDMIHLQQQATPNCDIIAGLCVALARNLKSSLGCGREFVKPIVFTGGVAANAGVVRAIKEVFELQDGELIVPKEHFFTGAIGAVLTAKSKGQTGSVEIDLKKIDSYLAQEGTAVEKAARRPALRKPSLPVPESIVYEHLLSDASEPINAYLGVDVGSISTNVVVMDEEKRVLAKEYLMTAGRPLEAVRKGLKLAGDKVKGKVRILGAATTGSGRYLTGDFIGADLVINEITAQAAGTTIVNPKVDTIFEIGGQDSKYISLENGVITDFEMNHACAAGTGSFLEEQAQRLGISINEQFAELAFRSDKPIKLGERCTVFMESDMASYQQQGAKTEELVAGLSYSIVNNYLNRVVGRRKIGNNICFQGGTAFNKAVWSAFEQVTGKVVMVPDHHEVTGALGAASIAAEYMKKAAEDSGQIPASKFRGFEEIVNVNYSQESFVCGHCANHCEIKKVQLPGSEPLYYGSRCDRYNIKKSNQKHKGPGAFEYRTEMLLKYAGIEDRQMLATSCERVEKDRDKLRAGTRTKIGIPMALAYWQLLPLFARFFRSLGFEVVLSGPTSKQVVRRGIELVTAQPCFPVKVAYGHIAELIAKKADYIFLPSIVSMRSNYSQSRKNQLCPYVQSLVYQAQPAFANRLGETEILTAVLRLGEGDSLLRKSFGELGKKLGFSRRVIGRSIDEALEAQSGFEQSLVNKGAEYLKQAGPDEKIAVLISRPYNGCDEGMNLQLPKKLAELGVKVMPMDMLDLDSAPLSEESLHKSAYWVYGQKILRAAEIIKRDARLYAIYLSNFACGPDSFLMTFFKEIMGHKPCLQLELDEHSADAGVITRLEAFLDSLKNYHPERQQPVCEKVERVKSIGSERKLYVPYMSDCSYGLASCLKAYGQPAEVMPICDEAGLLRGRAFTTGKECLPLVTTAGEMLKVMESEGNAGHKVAFLMPGASGPCRFGMYNCMHKLILRYAGAGNAAVIAPNQDSGFYSEMAASVSRSAARGFMKDAWTALVGLDLLGKLVLRIRPFAKDRQSAQLVYDWSVRQWLSAVEQRKSLWRMRKLMGIIAHEFGAVELDNQSQKARIGIVGEIYVRNHPFANMNVVRKLENLGAVCDLASLAEWIYYTNFTRKQTARRGGQMRNLLTNIVQNICQHRVERILAEPLEERFGKLAEEPVEEIIKLARPYMHYSLEGEAILTIGKTIEYYHQGFGGVVNVMPFSCMPSIVVSSQTTRVSADCEHMPILDLSFDGQEDLTYTTRLEAFVEQVQQRQGSLSSAAELLRVR
ncbi:MAG TPA: acyl-CoA dehydratase activase [Sedimentisphaerales bacterium]|nr:acyl-CoA dehydratase activase [Sedimentisphaerales bacterium]